MKTAFNTFMIFISILASWLTIKLYDYPSLTPYADLWLDEAEPSDAGLRITWLGVSTLLIDDGKTAIMTDGFFSRPDLLSTATRRISPDNALITKSLKKLDLEHLAAVFVVHSHYDHSMDAPEVARQTGALLVGSESTLNVGRGWGLTEDRMARIQGGEEFQLGRFKVSVIKTRHFPHGKAMGDISQPLTTPARATAYLEGGSFSIHIEHEEGRMLIQGSAGYVNGALDDYPTDLAFLGIGLLGTEDVEYQQNYWHETVETTGAKRVIPIHWDDFFLPLNKPSRPFPTLFDDFETAMTFILNKGKEQGVEIKLLKTWTTIHPFQD